MIKKAIIKIINIFPKGKLITSLISLEKIYLRNEGWSKSILERSSIDKFGNELPWFTYSCIHFLSERLDNNQVVFEYGSGNSTVWFSSRIGKIVSVEHDEVWYNQMKDRFSKILNINYLLRNIDSLEYQNEVLEYSKEFDIIVIDGRKRVECSKNSLGALKNNGVIIWDNSDRMKYSEGFKFLEQNSFKKIDFWGLGPINPYSWCTTIFYKEHNCLNI